MVTKEQTEQMIDNFHWNVYAIRMNRGITQQALADMANLSHVSISRIDTLTGGTSLWTALNVTQALGMDLGDMFNKRFELNVPAKPMMGRRTNRERGKV